MSSESDLIKVKSYYDGSEAEIAKAKLLAHGIFCSILSDNLGGQRLDLNETLGSSLLVKRSDFDKAESLLNDVYSEDDQELHQDDINTGIIQNTKETNSYLGNRLDTGRDSSVLPCCKQLIPQVVMNCVRQAIGNFFECSWVR